jgi:hypothetical protein
VLTTVNSSAHIVDRTVRSFVHSERQRDEHAAQPRRDNGAGAIRRGYRAHSGLVLWSRWAAWKSACSCVSSMNASSSDALCVKSS